MNALKIMLVFLLGLVAFWGCEKDPGAPAYQREISVYGFLWGNENLTEEHAISLKYSLPISQYYDENEAAVRAADVTLTDLSDNTVTALFENEARPGYYYNAALTIQPGHTYRLEISADGKSASAQTTVPADLELTTELSVDTTTIVNEKDWSYKMPVVIQHENPEQIFLCDMFCNEEWQNAEYIKPFHKNHPKPTDRNEYDGGVNGEPRHIQVLVPYKDLYAPEFGGNAIYWYASMFVFRGSYTLMVAAIDDNYHHYLTRENPVYSGGVQGGIGVFGSLVGNTFPLFVTHFEVTTE